MLGVDSDVELERRKYEEEKELDSRFYPHIIQNQEDKGIDTPGIKPALPKKEVTPDKQKNTPEVTNFKKAELNLEIAPYKTNEDLPEHLQYLPEGAKTVFRNAFNAAYPKGEDYAFPVAYSAMKRWLKKHGYTKVNDKWIKKGE